MIVHPATATTVSALKDVKMPKYAAGLVAPKPAEEAAPLQAGSQKTKQKAEASAKPDSRKAEANGDTGELPIATLHISPLNGAADWDGRHLYASGRTTPCTHTMVMPKWQSPICSFQGEFGAGMPKSPSCSS